MYNFTFSTDGFKIFTIGPLKIKPLIAKIRRNYKRQESFISLIFIFIGLITGIIVTPLLLYDVIKFLVKNFNLTSIEIVVAIVFVLFMSSSFASFMYFISKWSIDLYNIKKYGHSNYQYSPLLENEIIIILNNSSEHVNISRGGIKTFHETICTFIKEETHIIERQKLKSAHWIFRKGNLIAACKSNPLLAEALATCMTETDISKEFIKRNINISYLTKHLTEGSNINDTENRIENLMSGIENVMSELVVLQTQLKMFRDGKIETISILPPI